MIEPIMYFGIGFLVAALIGLLFVPLVHNRAVRLTMRRLEAATPLSIAEIRADKDQLRAEFAMSTRRLEMSVEQMKTKTTTQLAELGKKTDAINQLKKELGEKTATIFALESRDKALRDQLRATEEEFELKIELAARSRAHALRQGGGARQTARRARRTLDHRRQPARRTRGPAHAGRSDEGQRQRLRTRREGDRGAADARARRRRRGDGGADRGARQARQPRQPHRGSRTAAYRADDRSRHAQQARAGTRNAARRSGPAACRARLRARPAARRTRQPRARSRPICARNSRPPAAAAAAPWTRSASNIAELETQLAAALEERAKLQREIGTMRREAESTWAAERVENALLRERINDVAAEVARLTAALEGPGSPIESMLADRRARGRPTARTASTAQGEAGHGRHRLAAGQQEHAGRPHPRPAIDRLARRADDESNARDATTSALRDTGALRLTPADPS